MRAWEIARRPRLIVYGLSENLSSVRSVARKYFDEVIPVARDRSSERIVGFLTPIELILATSHYTSLRVRDVVREHPLVVQDSSLEEIYREMQRFGVLGVPVVYSTSDDRLLGVITYGDIINYLLRSGYKPIAETVSEVMTTDDLDKYVVSWKDRVNRAWARIVYRGLPGLVVVRSMDEWRPMGIVTYREFIRSTRWFFHRESEHSFTSPAKIQRIMLRGTLVASSDMPLEAVAKAMVEQELPLIPVVDRDGIVVGVLTYMDVIRAYLEGAKPGRVPVPIARVIPVPVAREERIVFVSREKMLSQVLVGHAVEPVYTGLYASDAMVSELPAITINDTVEHARLEMLRRKTNYLLVVDEKNDVVGYVSKWSMLHAIGLHGQLWRRRSKDRYFIDYVMVKRMPHVKEDTPLEEVAFILANTESEIAIVESSSGDIIGFITKDRVVEASKKILEDYRVENLILPGKIAYVNPYHSLYHVVNKMKTLYLDALTVYDGEVLGVISANRLPFIALEDSKKGVRSKRLIWVRKLVRGGAKRARYVKITPLLAIDAMVPYRKYIEPETRVSRVIEEMYRVRLDGIPVLSNDRKIISTITKNDVIRELARRAKKIIEKKIEVKQETKRKQ